MTRRRGDTETAGTPSNAPPVGLLRIRLTVSSLSSERSFVIGTVKLRLFTPGPKLKVPEAAE